MITDTNRRSLRSTEGEEQADFPHNMKLLKPKKTDTKRRSLHSTEGEEQTDFPQTDSKRRILRSTKGKERTDFPQKTLLKPKKTDANRRSFRSTEGEEQADFTHNSKLLKPKKVTWNNQDVMIYRMESSHYAEKDLQFVIYIPVDSPVTWHKPSADGQGGRSSIRSGRAGSIPSMRRSKGSDEDRGKPKSGGRSSKLSKHSGHSGPVLPRGAKESKDDFQPDESSKRPHASVTGSLKSSIKSSITSTKSPKQSKKLADDEHRPKGDSARSADSGVESIWNTHSLPHTDSDIRRSSVAGYIGKKKKSMYQPPPMGFNDTLDSEEGGDARSSNKSPNLEDKGGNPRGSKKSDGGSSIGKKSLESTRHSDESKIRPPKVPRESKNSAIKRKPYQQSSLISDDSKTKSPKRLKNYDDVNNNRRNSVETSLKSQGSKRMSPKVSKQSDNSNIQSNRGSNQQSLDSGKSKSPKISRDSSKTGPSRTSASRSLKESNDYKSKPNTKDSKRSSESKSLRGPQDTDNKKEKPSDERSERSLQSRDNEDDRRKDLTGSKTSNKTDSPKQSLAAPTHTGDDKGASDDKYHGTKRKSVYDLPPADWLQGLWSTETEGTNEDGQGEEDEDEEVNGNVTKNSSMTNPLRSSEERYSRHKSLKPQKGSLNDEEMRNTTVPENVHNRGRSVHFVIPPERSSAP